MGAKHIRQAEADFIAQAYRKMPLASVVEAVNAEFGNGRTYNGLKQWTVKHGVLSGRTGQFCRQQEPWNKGKKGVNGYSSTRFKPGSISARAKPLLSERVGKDGEIQIKVRKRGKTYISKARWLWEQDNGPLPRGHIVRFKDGDNRNLSPANLVAVSRHLHLRLNASDYAMLPPELKQLRLSTEALVVAFKDRQAA